MTIRFEEPPLHRGGNRNGGRENPKYRADAAALMSRPGEWAIVHAGGRRSLADGLAYQIKSGKIAAYRPAGAFEAMARTVDGEYRTYARYVGGVDRG